MTPIAAEPPSENVASPNPRKNHRPAAKLNPLELEVVAFFVQICRLTGQPPSLGEIYGLLFISAQPLALDDLIERLGISKASASQGLKFLRNVGAVKMVYLPGDRRILYEAVAELRNLAKRMLQDQVMPQLEGGRHRLEYISEVLKKMPTQERARFSARVTMLQSWEKKTRKFLPLVLKLMGG